MMMRERSKDYRRWITSRRWGQLRRQKLTQSPLCQRCQALGRLTSASEVHHIRPVEDGVNRMEQEQLMFSPNNLMALCHQCHVEIHVELGRGSRRQAAERKAQSVTDVINRFFPPTD